MRDRVDREAGASAPPAGGGRSPVVWRSARHDELLRQGWQRRFVASSPRLEEMTELYESLGLEVRVEPAADPGADGPCGDCALARFAFRVVYTRARSRPGGTKDH